MIIVIFCYCTIIVHDMDCCNIRWSVANSWESPREFYSLHGMRLVTLHGPVLMPIQSVSWVKNKVFLDRVTFFAST